MSFYFLDSNYDFEDDSSKRVIVHASLDSDLPVVRFDVDLGSLPDEDIGYEFVVSFTDPSIKN